MWQALTSRKSREKPRLPRGLRIYAIGDVHGRGDLLADIFAQIDADIAHYPAPLVLHVFLGDYIDRGPASSEVIERLVRRSRTHKIICLKGNHETYVEDFLRDPATLEGWRHYGGLETLISYGLQPSITADAAERQALAQDLAYVLPPSHQRFLAALKPSFSCGDYFFVHAGVKPGVPLADQREEDLLWIREDFLRSEDDFGQIIVHGHTPVREPEIRSNRINIDTGAYATGRLTCLVMERDEIAVL